MSTEVLRTTVNPTPDFFSYSSIPFETVSSTSIRRTNEMGRVDSLRSVPRPPLSSVKGRW